MSKELAVVITAIAGGLVAAPSDLSQNYSRPARTHHAPAPGSYAPAH